MSKLMRAAVLCLCCLAAGPAGGAQKLKIGVFDQRAAGGQGASVDQLIEGLNELGYAAEPIRDLHPLALAPCDVIYLSDMHEPGNVAENWRRTLTSFVRAGGGVLQTWHHHQFPQVGVGVKRVYGQRRIHVVPGHAAAEGLADFDASFADHIIERETGKPVAHWPEDCISGPRHGEWVEYRCRRISALVERISTRIREAAPRVKISAAVFRNWPDCRETNGQDWVRWCQEGWLDFVCPMNYTLDDELFAERAAIHRHALPEGFPLVEGIGIASSAGRMRSPPALALQIALARRAGATGFLGFAYQPGHTAALFAPLRDWLGVGR